ncbi:MAG: methyltransferase family protein [Thermodesulfobacteriota bacterium]
MFARYALGYLIGVGVFLLVIPYGLYQVAQTFSGQGFRLAVALPLGIMGLAFALWSNVALVLQGKGGPTDLFNVAISPRTKYLVVTGPYRYTRNPMVFGAFSFYAALAIYWNSLSALAAVALFFAFIKYYLKEFEEQRLLADFGQEYELYRQQVPMIVPWPFR